MKWTGKELLAGGLALCIASPIVFFFGRALADGYRRYHEGPTRAMVGSDAFDTFLRGNVPPAHYVGDNRIAPDFALHDRDGATWRLSDHRGKVIFMNFWTVTCGPCVEEMPSIESLAGMMHDDTDVEFVTVSVDQGWDDVSAVLSPSSRLRVLFDPDRAVTREKYGTRLFPETWLIDGNGIIRVRIDGGRDWANALAVDLIRSYE